MSKSHYSSYLEERLGKRVEEFPEGFLVYSYLDGGKQLYIEDIYVIPEARKKGAARLMADTVIQKAKMEVTREVIGSVDLRANGACDSMKVLLAYGMKPYEARGQLVLFGKEI